MPLGEIFIKWKLLSPVLKDLSVFQAYWLLHQPLPGGGQARNAHNAVGYQKMPVGGGRQKGTAFKKIAMCLKGRTYFCFLHCKG